MEAALDEVRAALSEADPRLAAALGRAAAAEWWAHSRTPHEGHQLHFDTDERSLRAGAEVAHPLVSAVLFLEVPDDDDRGDDDGADAAAAGDPEGSRGSRGRCRGGRGRVVGGNRSGSKGGTVVIDQRLGEGARSSVGSAEGGEGQHAWVAQPVANRVIAFDGGLLHGVLPAAAADRPAGDGEHSEGGGKHGTKPRRLTLMVGWWGPGLRPGRGSAEEAFGPCMVPPWRGGYRGAGWSWPDLFAVSAPTQDPDGAGARELSPWGAPPPRSRSRLASVPGPAWEAVEVGGGGGAGGVYGVEGGGEGGGEGWGGGDCVGRSDKHVREETQTRMPPVHPGLRFFLRSPNDFEEAYALHQGVPDDDDAGE